MSADRNLETASWLRYMYRSPSVPPVKTSYYLFIDRGKIVHLRWKHGVASACSSERVLTCNALHPFTPIRSCSRTWLWQTHDWYEPFSKRQEKKRHIAQRRYYHTDTKYPFCTFSTKARGSLSRMSSPFGFYRRSREPVSRPCRCRLPTLTLSPVASRPGRLYE